MEVFPYVWSWLTMQASNLGSSCLELSTYPLSITLEVLHVPLVFVTIHMMNTWDQVILVLEALNIVLELFSNTSLLLCLSFTIDLLVWYAMKLHKIFFTFLSSSSLCIGDLKFNLDVYTDYYLHTSLIFIESCTTRSSTLIPYMSPNHSCVTSNLFIHHEFIPVKSCS